MTPSVDTSYQPPDIQSILNFSTLPVLDKLEELVYADLIPIDTVLFNLTTLARNVVCRIPPHLLTTDLFRQLIREIESRCRQIFLMRPRTTTATIMFYCNRFRHLIPLEQQVSYNRQSMYEDMVTQLVRCFGITGDSGKVAHTDNNVQTVLVYDTPARYILRNLRTVIENETLSPKRGIAMISHDHCDPLILTKFSSGVFVIQSFTTAILRPPDFAGCFLDVHCVPFCESTLQLFGVKGIAKGTIRGAKKKQLVEIAQQNAWHNLPPDVFFGQLIQHDFYSLTEDYPRYL